MTSQEKTEIATLGVTLAAFIERYERDQQATSMTDLDAIGGLND